MQTVPHIFISTVSDNNFLINLLSYGDDNFDCTISITLKYKIY